ncbi:septal ring lytic transglycosylase RlpA family protein [Caballeronia sp. LZ062]|nr:MULTISPECIES: septal ring lytic transglycosylase RlpA family protein [unclassified Caballeronia]MDR5856276.1 septal ring lytic transglycosylase RlpA family protein [Caballeronia sp. LZ050]MDR5872947.1 septal ring lytic transglycosylase RlpA family protein [Caballeronia sp. LZ062]
MVAKAWIRRSRVAGVASVGAWMLLSGCAAHRPAAATPPPQKKPQEESAPAAAAASASAVDAPAASAPDSASAPAPIAEDASPAFRQVGEASYYSGKFQGRRTASGERYDMHALTAAHRTLPLGSYVRVSNVSGTKSVVVKINDRGPFVKTRVIDLSFAAASVLGLQQSGRARVVLEPVTPVALELAPAHGSTTHASATHASATHASATHASATQASATHAPATHASATHVAPARSRVRHAKTAVKPVTLHISHVRHCVPAHKQVAH